MTLQWDRADGRSFLCDVDNDCKFVISIFNTSEGTYRIHLFEFKTIEMDLDSMAVAEWQAVLKLYDACNQKANYYHNIRDHLPSIHYLAERAGII